MHPRSIYAALIFVSSFALLAGCGGSSGNGGGGACNDPTSLCGSDPTTTSISKLTPEKLTATLSESQTVITTTGSVSYTVTLTNTTSANVSVVTYYDPTGNPAVPAGVTITDSLGTQVYPNQGSDTPPTPTTVILTPGQSLSSVVTTYTPPHQGRFLATASFSFNGNTTSVGKLTVSAH